MPETSETNQEDLGPIVRIWIEPTCLLHDMCVEACPEVFKIEDEPADPSEPHIAILTPDASNYFQTHRDQIEEAASLCPMTAIKIQYENGMVYDGTDHKPADDAH